MRTARLLTLITALLLAPRLSSAQTTLQIDLDGRAGFPSANGRFIAGAGSSGGAAVWSLGTGWVDIGGSFPGRFVSNDGDVVVAGGLADAEIWESGIGWRPVGSSAGQPGALSSDGHCVAYFPLTSTRSEVWDRRTGVAEPVPLPPGAASALILALSADGQLAVGTADVPGQGFRAFVWDRTLGQVDLITPLDPAMAGARAAGVSENGEWVVGTRGTNPSIAFRWNRSAGLLDLPAVPGSGPGVARLARFVTDDGGTIHGDRFEAAASDFGAFVWTSTGGTRRLRDWFASGGGDDPGPFTTLIGAPSSGRRYVLADGVGGAVQQVHYNDGGLVSFSFCGPAVPNSTGDSAELFALGSNIAPRNALFLRAVGLPADRLVVPVASRAQDLVPMVGGGAGTLCLGGSIGRFGPGRSGLDGRYEMQVDTGALPDGPGSVAALAGQTWNFQVWFQDPASGGSNLTDGASVFFD